jgi:hypothetical protein
LGGFLQLYDRADGHVRSVLPDPDPDPDVGKADHPAISGTDHNGGSTGDGGACEEEDDTPTFLSQAGVVRARADDDSTNTTELSFDVSLTAEDDGQFERNFLQRMRDTLSDPTADRGRCSADGRQILMLHPQTDSPVLMNLTLLAGGASVTLSVRTDNLYVVGFRNSAGAWFEIRPDDVSGRPGPRLIQGATLLPFGGSYQEGGLGLLHLVRRSSSITSAVNKFFRLPN